MMTMTALAERSAPSTEIPGWVPTEHMDTYHIIASTKGEERAASIVRQLKRAAGEERWDAASVHLMIKLWLQGATSGATASVMGNGFTRNAVIGKRSRLGLESQRVVSRPSKVSTLQPKMKSLPKPLVRPKLVVTRPPSAEAPAAPKLIPFVRPIAESDPAGGVPFMETRLFQCRFVISGEGYEAICCGGQTVRGSYCAIMRPASSRARPRCRKRS